MRLPTGVVPANPTHPISRVVYTSAIGVSPLCSARVFRILRPTADMAFWARSFIVPSADAMEVEDEVPEDLRYA